MRLSNAEIWMIALGWLSTMLVIVVVNADPFGPDQACMDFAAGDMQLSSWTVADCTEVWTQFVETIPMNQRRRQHYADGWRGITTELRLAGSPCLCASHGGGDGVGSMTMRILSSWIFSEEMGCDWVTPEWNRRHVNGKNGTVLYCHRTATIAELKDPSVSPLTLDENNHCSVVDWLAYFQFNLPSVNLPKGEKIKAIEVGGESVKELEVARWSANGEKPANQVWDRILFKTNVNFATRSLTAIANWDIDRRETVRTVMAQARHNFHVHPRPWYSENPECGYDPEKLNFALHVRMGDRRHYFRREESEQYFILLELFMDTVSKEVVRKGLDPPVFHVFSETLVPCPSEDTGIFDEFPSWPVHQVPECLTAVAPDDCPEKQAGIRCRPNRPGIFDVIERPVVLHVGPDVPNAMSCMILADGVLMGCSTFGQVAGLLSQGISFFSMQCSGEVTPNHYKIIPPIAVSERGYLWVPMAGSWRDPIIYSTEVLIGALDALLENKAIPSR